MTSDAEAAREDVRGKFHLPVKCIFREPMESVPFEMVVEELYGFKARKFDPEADGKLLERIGNAMRDACLFARKDPIKRNRPNEVGNDMEPLVVKALKSHGMAAAAPKTRSGRGRSAGYPDVKVDIDPVPIFLEVKTYSASTRRSSQRSGGSARKTVPFFRMISAKAKSDPAREAATRGKSRKCVWRCAVERIDAARRRAGLHLPQKPVRFRRRHGHEETQASELPGRRMMRNAAEVRRSGRAPRRSRAPLPGLRNRPPPACRPSRPRLRRSCRNGRRGCPAG